MCAITLWLRALFSSRTLRETIEASEATFLFSYVFCSLSSILFLENGTDPQCVTTLTQNARPKLRLILSHTSYLAIGCKNFGCFWFNCFLVFCLLAAKTLVVFGLTASSFFALDLSTRNFSCPSASSFNQLLKSKSVGRCQLCLTICIDQASLSLGGILLTTWFNRLTLFKSSLKDNDLKTATRPDMAEEN